MRKSYFVIGVIITLIFCLSHSIYCGIPPVRKLKLYSRALGGAYSCTVEVDYSSGYEATQIQDSWYNVYSGTVPPFPGVYTRSAYNYRKTLWNAYYETPISDVICVQGWDPGGYYSDTYDIGYNPYYIGEYLKSANFKVNNSNHIDYTAQYTSSSYPPTQFTFNSFMRPGVVNSASVHYTSYYAYGYPNFIPDTWSVINDQTPLTMPLEAELVYVTGTEDYPFVSQWNRNGSPYLGITRASNLQGGDMFTSPEVGLYSYDQEISVVSTTYSYTPEGMLYFNSLRTYDPHGEMITWTFDYLCPDYGLDLLTATVDWVTGTGHQYSFEYDYFGTFLYSYLPSRFIQKDYIEEITSTYSFDYKEIEGYNYLFPSRTDVSYNGDTPTTVCRVLYDEELTSPIASGSYYMWNLIRPGEDFPCYSAGQQVRDYLYLLDSQGAPLGHVSRGGWHPSFIIYAYDPQGRLSALWNIGLNWGYFDNQSQLKSLVVLGYDEAHRAYSAIRMDGPFVHLNFFQYDASGFPDLVIDAYYGGFLKRFTARLAENGPEVPIMDRSVSSFLFNSYGDLIPPVHRISPYVPPTPISNDIIDYLVGKTSAPPGGDVNQDGVIDIADLVALIKGL